MDQIQADSLCKGESECRKYQKQLEAAGMEFCLS
jgi:hypothetical protein